MPHANVWIRKEDWELWEPITNKAAFVHAALNDDHYYWFIREDDEVHPAIKKNDIKESIEDVPVIKGQMDKFNKAWSEIKPSKAPDPELGYPCCTKQKPCKHWAYDGNQGLWVNELTGKTREVV